MERKFCSECGSQLNETDKVCSRCGVTLTSDSRKPSKRRILLVTIGVLVIGAAAIAMLGRGDQESSLREASKATTVEPTAIEESQGIGTVSETTIETSVLTETRVVLTTTQETSTTEPETSSLESTSETATGETTEAEAAEGTSETATEISATTEVELTYDFAGDWNVRIDVPSENINWELVEQVTGAPFPEDQRVDITEVFDTKLEDTEDGLLMTYAPASVIQVEGPTIQMLIPTETGLVYIVNAVMADDMETVQGSVKITLVGRSYADGTALITRLKTTE